jgi:hypothetical protein
MASLGTLTSDTKEGALLEIVEQLSALQEASATTANPKTMISNYSLDGLTGILNISITARVRLNPDATGHPVILVVEVFD